MRVKFSNGPRGETYADTSFRVNGGLVRLRAVTTAEEARRIVRGAPHRLGFKLTLKSLGKAAKAIAKPATLMKITMMAGRLSAGDPTALLSAPGIISDVKKGMAAKRVVDAAAAGNPQAQALLAQAKTAATAGDSGPPLGMPAGTWRYLVTLERLAQRP